MKKVSVRLTIVAFITALCFCATAQSNSINVAENTFKVRGMDEEIFYYAFAEGDQLHFTFREMKRKELKEKEILEYPFNSKFMEFKTSGVEKTITISRTGVYAFRFKNGVLLGRVCKVKIDRIPASDRTKNFNTAVKWVEKTLLLAMIHYCFKKQKKYW